MYRSILVTGGAGFVGSNLAIALRRGLPQAEVIALDNLRRRGSELNLQRLRAAGVRFVQGDIRCMEDLTDWGGSPDLILECSAEPSVLAGYGSSPEYLIRTNLLGCFHCLELARRARADFVFVSTSRIYPYRLLNQLAYVEEESRYALAAEQPFPGVSPLGISEEFPLTGARSPYGMTKLASELMVEEYGDAYGLRFIVNRCGLLTGPWQMAKSDQGVIALWAAAHCYGRPLSYIGFGGSGKQVRDFLHIDDFSDLILDQLTHFDSYAGGQFNVGGGLACSLSLLETTRLCQEVSGKSLQITPSAEERPADIRIYLSDHRRVSAVRGWRPQRGPRQTLQSIHDWLVAEESTVKSVIFGGS
jgi:CDP-paratose 2-epimerase